MFAMLAMNQFPCQVAYFRDYEMDAQLKYEIFLMNNFNSCVMIWNGNSCLIFYYLFIINEKLYLWIYTNSLSFE
jgi:hypothetical protein